ncbi:Hypothetical predicted protein, partial [Paramuricea clavata]
FFVLKWHGITPQCLQQEALIIQAKRLKVFYIVRPLRWPQVCSFDLVSLIIIIKTYKKGDIMQRNVFPQGRKCVRVEGSICRNNFLIIKTGENVERNERQIKQLEDMNKDYTNTGTVSVVRERLSKHLKNVEKIYGETQSDLTKVQLSRKFEPSCVAKASDSILLCANDADKLIYSITLQMDGVAVKGDVTIFAKYPSSCTEVVSMCLNLNILYLSHKGNPGGITAIAMSTLEETTIVRNGTTEYSESAHAAPYLDGIVYADTGSLQIKSKIPGKESVVIAGTGKEGNLNGKADKVSFAQPMGICVELDKNIFITDAQTGLVKLITSITGIVKFFSHLGLLYKAFSVHMKHQTVPKHTLSQVIKLLEEEKALSHINDGSGRKSQPSGAHGTISTQTKVSVTMILNGLKHLEELVNEHNPDYIIDLHSCLTVQ